MSNYTAEERVAWDGYMAGAISGYLAGTPAGDIYKATTSAAYYADAMLAARRARFGVGEAMDGDLKAVAEELAHAVVVAQARLNFKLVGDAYHAEMRRLGCVDGERTDDFANRVLAAAIARARAMGLTPAAP